MTFSSKLVSSAVFGLALWSGSASAFTTVTADGFVVGNPTQITEGATQAAPIVRPLAGDSIQIAATRLGNAYDIPSQFTVLASREFEIELPDEDDPSE